MWLRLYQETEDRRWLNAGLKAVEQAVGRQERLRWPSVHGALTGSFPDLGQVRAAAVSDPGDQVPRRCAVCLRDSLERDVDWRRRVPLRRADRPGSGARLAVRDGTRARLQVHEQPTQLSTRNRSEDHADRRDADRLFGAAAGRPHLVGRASRLALIWFLQIAAVASFPPAIAGRDECAAAFAWGRVRVGSHRHAVWSELLG